MIDNESDIKKPNLKDFQDNFEQLIYAESVNNMLILIKGKRKNTVLLTEDVWN